MKKTCIQICSVNCTLWFSQSQCCSKHIAKRLSADYISNSLDQSRAAAGRKGAQKGLSLWIGLGSRDAFPLTNFLPPSLSSLLKSHTHPTSQLVILLDRTFGILNIYHMPSRHIIGANERSRQMTSWQRLALGSAGGWGTHPTSLATEECRDIDFGDISNSESDLGEIKLFKIENVKMHFYLLASTAGGIFAAMLRLS